MVTLGFGSGAAANQDRFNDLTFSGSGTLFLAGATYASGTFATTQAGPVNVTGQAAGSQPFTFRNRQAAGTLTVFDNLRVVVSQAGTGTPVGLDNTLFQNTDPTVAALALQHPGISAGSVDLTNLTFGVVPSSGLYLSATDNNTGDGIPLVVNLFNPNPVTPSSFVATGGGATVNWPAASPAKTWLGTNSDWHTTTNWSPAGLPTAADDVVIPVTANNPFLSAPATTRSLTIQSGALLNLNGFGLDVSGDLVAPNATSMTGGGGTLTLSGTARTLGGTLATSLPVSVTGTYALSARTTIGGLTIGGTGDLDANAQTLVAGGALTTVASGTLTMTNALDSVLVTGAGIFGGGFTGGRLTAGYLKIGGSFNQTSGTTPGSFAASGAHRTELGSAAVRVATFASPGFGTGTSQFNDLIVSGATGGLTLNSNVAVLGQLISQPVSNTPIVSGTNRTLTVRGGTAVTGLVLDGVPLVVDAAGSAGPLQFDGVDFNNMPATASQFTLIHPGTPAPFSFTNLVFTTVPSSGRYLDVTDSDGASPDALVVNLFTPTPATSGGFVQAAGGAVINWPGVVPATQWTGASSSDWNLAANWSTGAVPNLTTAVVIPEIGRAHV